MSALIQGSIVPASLGSTGPSGPTGPASTSSGPTGPTGPTPTSGPFTITQAKEIINDLGTINTDQNVDLSLGDVVRATFSGSSKFTFINPAAAGVCSTVTLVLTNALGNLTWNVAPKWSGGTPPTLTTGVDVLTLFTMDAGVTWYGVAAGTAFA